MDRDQALACWDVTFTELRLAGVTLKEWLAFKGNRPRVNRDPEVRVGFKYNLS